MTVSFSPVKRAPAYQKVFEAIQNDILSGTIPEGAMLPTEGDLADQFKVHRSTVREGIRLLEQAGLVTRGAAKRMYVHRPQASETAERARMGLMLHGVSFLEVWEALSIIQPEAIRLANGRLQPDDLATLKMAAHALADEPNADKIVDAAGAFFQTIAASLNNRVMLVVLQSLNLLVMSSLARVIDHLPDAGRRIGDAQSAMIDALMAADGDAAALWMHRHIDDLKRGYDVAGVDINSQIS